MGPPSIAERYPNVVKVVGLVALSLVGLKIATLGAKFAGTLLSDTWLMANGVFSKVAPTVALNTSRLVRLRAASFAASGGLKGFATRSIPLVITALKGLSIATLANPIGLAVAGIAVAALLIVKFWKPIKAFMVGVITGIAEAFGASGQGRQDRNQLYRARGPSVNWVGQVVTGSS